MVIVYVVVVSLCNSPLCVRAFGVVWCGVLCVLCGIVCALCMCSGGIWLCVFRLSIHNGCQCSPMSVPLLLHFQGNNVMSLEMSVIEGDSNQDSKTNDMVMWVRTRMARCTQKFFL